MTTDCTPEKLEEYLEFAKALAQKCGKVILDDYNQTDKRIEFKSNVADLVTASDSKVEAMIIDAIKSAYPEHHVIAEESQYALATGSGAAGSAPSKKPGFHTNDAAQPPTWMVDPIDGTTNFVHRFPHCCVSLALCVAGKPAVGCVFNPVLNRMFWARKGGGAFLNGQPISCNSWKREISECLLGTGVGGAEEDIKLTWILENYRTLIKESRGLRIFGSAALSLCFVACGSLDMYFEAGAHCWDYAAGLIILYEAGGHSSNVDGSEPHDIMDRNCLAACNSRIAGQLAQRLLPAPFKLSRDDDK